MPPIAEAGPPRLPWFPLHASEYLADLKVGGLTLAQEGLLLRFWCLAWAEGGLPNDLATLQRLAKNAPADDLNLVLSRFFVLDDETGVFVSPRLEERRAMVAGQYAASERQRQRWREQKRRQRGAGGAPAPASGLVPVEAAPASPPPARTRQKAGTALVRTRKAELVKAELTETLAAWSADAAAKRTREEVRGVLAEAVFVYWATSFNHARTLYDPKRARRITEALKANGDDVSELFYTIDGARKDEWVRAAPGRDGVDYLFRDRSAIEKYAERCPGYVAETEHPRASALRQKVQAAMQDHAEAVA